MATSKRKSKETSATRPLVIVESPNKVKTISKILGEDYVVRASVGHFADIPATKNGVEIENDFALSYALTKKGVDIIDGLRKDLANASEVILATDADREGEMIAYLLDFFLKPNVPVSRIEFRNITKKEVLAALDNRRQINMELVEAARARRALDHLVGFQVSPVLWSKVRQNLSAGRVQSPALRLIVEREMDRIKFVEVSYCGVDARLEMTAEVTAGLRTINTVPVATSKDIDEAGVVAAPAELLLVPSAQELVARLSGVPLTVADSKNSKYTRKPYWPYTTSTLLQDILSRLHLNSNAASSILNQLYEKGLISYPRTDSAQLAPWTTEAAREQVIAMFGPNAVPETAPRFPSKKRSAQEAHEAIRPSDFGKRKPAGLTPQQLAVYELIWRRTVASQMLPASGTTVTVTFTASAEKNDYVFTAAGTTITEPGFRRLYSAVDDDEPTPLATFTVGDTVQVRELVINEHITKPPARFTESSLIKALEAEEIGRPSTYVPIISSLRNEYVWSKQGDQALIPTVSAVAVCNFLNSEFKNLMNYKFTRQMEDRLDAVVEGADTYLNVVRNFYEVGDATWSSLKATIDAAMATYKPEDHPVKHIGMHPETGESIDLRAGKSFAVRTKQQKSAKKGRGGRSSGSPYFKYAGRNFSVPDAMEFGDITLDFALALMNAPRVENRVIGEFNGEQVEVRTGPYGPYIARGKVNVSLPKEFDPATVTMEEVLPLMQFPRSLGTDVDGEEVLVKLGQYGPHVSKAGENRSVASMEVAHSITLPEALELLAQPKKRRGKR
jgi:DNA topoisomerase I